MLDGAMVMDGATGDRHAEEAEARANAARGTVLVSDVFVRGDRDRLRVAWYAPRGNVDIEIGEEGPSLAARARGDLLQ